MPGSVARILAGAVRATTRALTSQCHMVVSEPKFVVISSGAELDKHMIEQPALRGGLRRSARNLGIDFTGGRGSVSKVRKARLKKMKARVPLFRRLRAAGARTAVLARASVNPALLYGVGVTGMSGTDLRTARVLCRSAFQISTAGRSLTLDLAMAGEGTDPAIRAHVEPVQYLCRALWDDWLPRAVILRALSGAASRVAHAARPWAVVRGPASGLAATLLRVGWAVSRDVPTRWSTHAGEIDILKLPPRATAALMREAVDRWLWTQERQRHPELSSITPTVYCKPVLDLLRPGRVRPDWGPLQQACLRNAVANGLWPQARLFGEGLADTDTCQACLSDAGTSRHRLYGCPVAESYREHYGCPRMFQQERLHGGLPLWTRVLLPDPTWGFPMPLLESHCVWELQPAGGLLEGEGYGDGSGLHPKFARVRRCGWGLVVHTPGLGVTARLRGPLPGLQQEVPAAESMALLVYLENLGVGEAIFFTDCMFVVDTFHKGPAFSSHGWFVYADIWRKIWVKARDVGLESIMVQWIPAHTSPKAVEDGLISHRQRECNEQADALAKAGAAMHPCCEITVTRLERTEKVPQAGGYVCRQGAQPGRQ